MLDLNLVLPSPAQGGILAIECRENDEKMLSLLKAIQDEAADIQARAERTFLEAVNGGCHIPVGAYCNIEGDSVTLDAMLGNSDGSILHSVVWNGSVNEVEEGGARELAEKLKEAVHG